MGNPRDIKQSSSEEKCFSIGDILELLIKQKTESIPPKLLLRENNPYRECAQPAGCWYCGGVRCPYDTEPKPRIDRVRPIIPRFDSSDFDYLL